MRAEDLARQLAREIDQGVHAYGHRLPFMADIGREHGMSRQTVGVALGMLAASGRVRTYADRRGTVVVAPPSRTWHLGRYASQSGGPKRQSTGHRDEIITEIRLADDAERAALGEDVTDVLVRTQVRHVDGAPVRHRCVVMPMEVAQLTPDGWDGTPPMLAESNVPPPPGMSMAAWCGMGVTEVVETIRVAVAGEEGHALGIPEGTPVLRKTTQGTRNSGTLAYLTITTYPINAQIQLGIVEPT